MQFHGPSPLPSRQPLADASLRGGAVDASRDAPPPGTGSGAPSRQSGGGPPSGQSGDRLAFTGIRAGTSGMDLALRLARAGRLRAGPANRLAAALVVAGDPGLKIGLDATRRETADDNGSSGNAEHGMTLGGLIH